MSEENNCIKRPKQINQLFNFVTVCSFIICLACYAYPVFAQADFETLPILQAKSILKPEILKGKYHTVDDQVKNNGLFNHYTIESPFGKFKANSTRALKQLVHEIQVIAIMEKVETGDTAVLAVKKSGENVVSGVKNLFTDPEGALEGAASGVSSIFNRAKETIGKRETTDAEDSKVEQLIGMSKAKGQIANKYGVNVYSRNIRLQEELDRLGRADYLGGLGVGVAASFVPGVGGIMLSASGAARLLQEAINTTPASELWVQNKKKLLEIMSDADTVKLFLNNPVFSPDLQTVLVAALEALKGVANRELFIKVALQASDPDMAKMMTEIAVMSAGYHKHIAPLKSFAPLARITRGLRADGTVVLLLPTDYIVWSEQAADLSKSLTNNLAKSEKAGLELWTLGVLSQRTQSEMETMGWKIHTNAGSQLIRQK